MTGISIFAVLKASFSTISRRDTMERRSLGTSMPTACLPGMGATMRTLEAASLRAMLSERLRDLGELDAGRRQDLEHRDDRALADARYLGLDLEFCQGIAQDLGRALGLLVDDPVLAVGIGREDAIGGHGVGLVLAARCARLEYAAVRRGGVLGPAFERAAPT